MTTFLDRLGDQLAAADRALAIASQAAPRRLRSPRRLALAGLAAVVVAVPALAATQPWSPWLGDDGGDHPTIATSPVPGDATAALGVLRRAQTDDDRSAAVRATLAHLPGEEAHGVRADSVRSLGAVPGVPGRAIVLASMEHQGLTDGTAQGVDNPVCAWFPSSPTSAGVGCWTPAEIAGGRANTMSNGPDTGEHYWGLAPDGVAQVATTFQDGNTRRAAVQDNFFDMQVLTSDELRARRGPLFPNGPRLTFLDASGREIATAASSRRRAR